MNNTLWVIFVHLLFRIETLDMVTAVQYLKEPDHELQVLGAAYIQHECYSNKEAKIEVVQTNALVVRIPLVIS